MANTDAAAPLPVWRTCLDVESQDAGHYLDYWNAPLLGMVRGAPSRALELGCAGGMWGARLKERFPGCEVIGVEPGRAAAALARTRLDRVIECRLEDLDFDAEAIAPGSLDLMVAADVLEHVVNPWAFLERARGRLASGGALLASIPNVRNLTVTSPLILDGRFPYTARGMLDITHLRFFTFEEISTMLRETGYRIGQVGMILSPEFVKLMQDNEGRENINLKVGRMTLENLSSRDLAELCASQFLVECLPA